jgi:hypothetical protein
VGWFSDTWDNIVDWTGDNIVSPIVDFYTDTAEWLRVEFTVLAHETKKKLAEWLDNDWHFLLFLLALVVVLIVLPNVILWIGTSGLTEALSGFVKAISAGIVKLTGVKIWIDLKLLDTVLKIFWSEYRDVRMSLTRAVSVMAADLGEGTGFIHALMESARGTYVGTAAIIGLPVSTAEIEWYNDAAKFTKKIDDKFRDYAKDPGLIYYDFVNEVLLPRAEELTTVQQAELDEIRESRDRLVQFEGGLELVRQSVDDFVVLMPAAIEAQFERRWDDVRPYIDDAIEVLTVEIIPRFEATVAAFEEHQEMQRKFNDKVLADLNQASSVWANYLAVDEEDQALATAGFAEIITDGESSEAVLSDPDAALWQGRLDRLTYAGIAAGAAKAPLAYEARFTGRVPAERKLSIPSPFVGAY